MPEKSGRAGELRRSIRTKSARPARSANHRGRQETQGTEPDGSARGLSTRRRRRLHRSSRARGEQGLPADCPVHHSPGSLAAARISEHGDDDSRRWSATRLVATRPGGPPMRKPRHGHGASSIRGCCAAAWSQPSGSASAGSTPSSRTPSESFPIAPVTGRNPPREDTGRAQIIHPAGQGVKRGLRQREAFSRGAVGRNGIC
jgi:hypothetical protein